MTSTNRCPNCGGPKYPVNDLCGRCRMLNPVKDEDHQENHKDDIGLNHYASVDSSVLEIHCFRCKATLSDSFHGSYAELEDLVRAHLSESR